MNAAVVSTSWSPRRWCLGIAAVVGAQALLALWLGDKQPVVPRRVTTESQVLLAPDYESDLAALADPTLFVWANPRGFSGAAWMRVPIQEYQSPEWTESPRFLPPRNARLETTALELVEVAAPRTSDLASKPVLPAPLGTSPNATALPARSSLRVEGELSERRLLSAPTLPSVPASDVLPETVVQVLVDAGGRTQSATLLASSGSKEADTQALALARSADWEALPTDGHSTSDRTARFALGQLVFVWHTIPPVTTDSSGASTSSNPTMSP